MSLIPQYGVIKGMVARHPGETQVGCVYCLRENIDAPVAMDIVYHWGGNSVCVGHMKQILAAKGN